MKLIFAAAAAYLCYLIQGSLYQRFWDRLLEVEVRFQDVPAVEGEEGILKETIRNRKCLPLPVLDVKFSVSRDLEFEEEERSATTDQTYLSEVFAVMPYQQITRTLHFRCKKRGYFESSEVELIGKDLFFTGSFVKKEETDASLYVYPKLVDAGRLEIPFQMLVGSVLAQKQLCQDPFELKGIRDYQSFDPMREVNWKATARTGQLKVNLYDSTSSQAVTLLLNLESDTFRTETALQEESIRLCASIALKLLGYGIPVRILGNGTDCLSGNPLLIEAGAGKRHSRMVMEALARLNTERQVPFEPIVSGEAERSGQGNQLYVLISSSRREEVSRAFERISRNASGSMWFVPLYKEDSLPAISGSRLSIVKWEVEHDKV